ncbi:arginase family protein [Gordonia sputi]|uniref:arginase family protein n=1 Tax=Gordonia sputi TaxID=36823 RepID=UPI00367F8189
MNDEPITPAPVGPVDAAVVPRYGGESTFARLPRLDSVADADVLIWGVPIDSGVSYRPGTRFGPTHIRQGSRLLRRPVYVSVDIDVLDPAHAPGTGTPEAGGLTSRELLEMVRGLAGLNIVGMDIVEVSPAYDHAELTALAAAHTAYELLSVVPARR